MVQGYYTLPEAAKFLRMPVDELKQLAQKGKLRSFQDRGTLRFRVQDIQELARSRGGSSDDHELALGDASLPAAKSGGSSGSKKAASPRTPAKQEGVPEVFDFDVDADNVDVGNDLPVPGSGAKSKPPGSKGRKAPTPTPGSDSDVRLVADGSDVTFSVPKDSDIKIPDSDVKISPDPLKPKTGFVPPQATSGAKRPSQLAIGSGAKPKSKLGAPSSGARKGTTPQPADSGVRLVPMDDDSDVKLHGSDDVPLGQGPDLTSTDSNVRLEKPQLPPADSSEGMLLTEEINLDEEIQRQQEQEKDKPPTKMKAKSELKLPTSSPFELSDSDLELPSELKPAAGPKTPRGAKEEVSDSSDFELAAQEQAQKDGSSDFDLVPAKDGSIVLEGGDSGDLSLAAGDDSEQVLQQEEPTELTGPTSGISLENPADQGISLEEGSDDASSDFDLSLDVEATPKPQLSRPADDSDSEFELTGGATPKPKKSVSEPEDSSEFDLSLDADADAPAAAPGDSSEFELNLEGSGDVAVSESDGEFELTLDDSGNQPAVEESAPQVKSKKGKTKMKPPSAEEQDIFDTDFEVPVLEDSSSDETVADSELESSDFDLALDDSELAQEEESGSQVVALDEEDSAADDGAVVDDVEVEEESSDFADLDEDVEVEDEDVEVEAAGETITRTKTIIQEKLIPAAPWGVMPVIFMLPCVVIMFLVGILGYELVGSTVGNKPPGYLTVEIASLLGQKFK
ncbi:MAG: hypothetical protein HY289_00140 [Planctomycetes bacterium]|nr:hypothetical protein [Planctomycetota bacterium]